MNKDRYGLNSETALSGFPTALRGDKEVAAYATITAALFDEIQAKIARVPIYLNIDAMPEDLLDALAYDFKIDWWDTEYSLEEKRQVFRDHWRVHRTLGTKAAIETALSAIYPDTTVLEWFEYGGEPYHFQVRINLTNDDVDSARMRRVLARLEYYKNLRSHNDGIRYFTRLDAEPRVTARVAAMGYQAALYIEVDSTLKEPPQYTAATDARAGVGRLRGVLHVDIREA